eukprot:CAMPEP_0174915224 /NCGR_PEP_ID=MMETSP1355-20121228/726_1 /TAXON_ID=464990 /ORGANISM="Hemiselmis tepida, Strain CCMP443" /LENGTH=75 /DNA_ID=CAMNT_0016160079 /DNA_START=62 /DNA_END=286 /DNA_ORIENTATION=+
MRPRPARRLQLAYPPSLDGSSASITVAGSAGSTNAGSFRDLPGAHLSLRGAPCPGESGAGVASLFAAGSVPGGAG